MIGLVYTTGSSSPVYDRPFDLAARLAFELLAARHPGDVRALTDATGGGVTAAAVPPPSWAQPAGDPGRGGRRAAPRTAGGLAVGLCLVGVVLLAAVARPKAP